MYHLYGPFDLVIRIPWLTARKSISSLLEPPKTRAEPVAKSGYRKFLTCHERKTGFLRLQRKYALKQEYNKSTFEPISLGTCYAICDQSADCVGFLWERTSCVWCNSKRKLSFNSTCTTPYYEKQYMGEQGCSIFACAYTFLFLYSLLKFGDLLRRSKKSLHAANCRQRSGTNRFCERNMWQRR